MEIVVNATFLIYAIRTDVSLLKELDLATTRGVAMEVENELGIDLEGLGVRIKPGESNARIPEEKREFLSETDLNLIGLAFKKRRRCMLVTDDRRLRSVAKDSKLKCYTTPLFIASMFREGKMSKDRCIAFLKALRDIYIRKGDIEMILKRIEVW